MSTGATLQEIQEMINVHRNCGHNLTGIHDSCIGPYRCVDSDMCATDEWIEDCLRAYREYGDETQSLGAFELALIARILRAEQEPTDD